jgi:hypothetical protein
MIDIKQARVELRTKSLVQIQTETAWTWASRAAAAYEYYRASKITQWLLDAEEYAHEAIEHAALAGVLPAVQAALATYR